MKHSARPAVIVRVRLSPPLQRVARAVTVCLMGGLAFLTAERQGSQPSAADSGAATDRAMAEASSLADVAQRELEERRPSEALAAFQRAYALSGDPTLLLEVGRLEDQVGSPARAAHALEIFLARDIERTSPQLQLARQRLKALGQHTARVTLQTNVQGAEVELEAQRGVAKSNSGFVVSLLLDVGERRINLSKPGYETQTVTLNLEPGEVRSLRVDLDKAARGRSQATPTKPRWARLDLDAGSERGRGLVHHDRAAL
jgi:hypothetical protein